MVTFNRRIDRFGRNPNGRDFIVGDIHGRFTKLAAKLARIGFNIQADRLFSVGDLVDRGPESDMACGWLTLPWFHAVRGNHEEMAMRWAGFELELAEYIANGGRWNAFSRQDFVQERAAIFATMPLAIELETAQGIVGIVHADCPAPTWAELRTHLERRDIEGELAADCCVWSRARIERKGEHGTVRDLRAVVVGHSLVPRLTACNNVLHIDTGGWKDDGAFTLLDAATLLPVEPFTFAAAVPELVLA